MNRLTSVKLLNMCMIQNGDEVLVLDKINTQWAGITFPGGHIEREESITESVIREVKEETGLQVDLLIPCGIIHWELKSKNERWIIFLYKTSSFSGELIEGTHEGKVFWMKCKDLKNSNLSSGMQTYLELFFNDNKNEAYAIWDEEDTTEFKIY